MLSWIVSFAVVSTVASTRLVDDAGPGIQDSAMQKLEMDRSVTNLTLASQLVEAGFGGFTCGESMAFRGESRLAMESTNKVENLGETIYCAPIYDMAFAVASDEDFKKAFPKCRKSKDRVHVEMCGMSTITAGVCDGDDGLPPSAHVWDCRQHGMLQHVRDYFQGMARDAVLAILFPPYGALLALLELPILAKDAYETVRAIEDQGKDRQEVAEQTEQFFETQRAGITELTLATTLGVKAEVIQALKEKGSVDQVRAVRAVYDALEVKAEEVAAAADGTFLQVLQGLPQAGKPA
jgi:hypothetical protein